MKILLRMIIVVIPVMMFCDVSGQEEDYRIISPVLFPVQYRMSFEQVWEYVQKGDKLMMAAAKAETELEAALNSENASSVKITQLKERVYRLQLAASTYYGDAHRLQHRILRRYLRAEHPLEYNNIKQDVRKQFRRAGVLRKRAGTVIPHSSPLSRLRQASGIEQQALDMLLSVWAGAEKYAVSEKSENFTKQLADSAVNSKEIELEIPPLMKPEIEESVEEVVAERTEDEIFFSIQFLAARKAVNNKQVRDVYDGELDVIQNRSEGWYRFSAGKFQSFDEAVAKMHEEGIHGFIVAFRGDKRINVYEARRLKDTN